MNTNHLNPVDLREMKSGQWVKAVRANNNAAGHGNSLWQKSGTGDYAVWIPELSASDDPEDVDGIFDLFDNLATGDYFVEYEPPRDETDDEVIYRILRLYVADITASNIAYKLSKELKAPRKQVKP